jgi:hypothetical protein
MKLGIIQLAIVGGAALALTGCAADPNELLGGGGDSLAAGENNTQHHFQQMGTGENGEYNNSADEVKAQDQQIGSPVVVARLHACAKIPYATLGNIMSSRGVNVANTTQGSAGQLYKTGAAALGVANYAGRVPEMLVPSTAALSKEFDILLAGAREIQMTKPAMTGCTNVMLTDQAGNFTKDGLSCLMGKSASATHVTVANDAIAQAQAKGLTQAEGQQIAIASLLEASHTCE